jgi:hypothetical protein
MPGHADAPVQTFDQVSDDEVRIVGLTRQLTDP